MKKIPVLFIALILFSCNSGSSDSKSSTADTTTTVTAEAPAVAKPAFVPFKVVVMQTKVKDFDKAETQYFSRDSLRNTYGISHLVIGRTIKDPSVVFVIDRIADVDKAKSFYSQALSKDMMNKAGVTALPGLTYAEFVQFNETPVQYLNGLAVTHHVKDYAAWLKMYNDQGDSLRRSNGMIERGIARNLDDSNTVSVLFEISDTAKARARMYSAEVRNAWPDGGVDSPPTFRWYTLVK